MTTNSGESKEKDAVAGIKRFLEIWCASESFRRLLEEKPDEAVQIHKLTVDPAEIRVLWDRQYAMEQDKKNISPNAPVTQYSDYTNKKLQWRNWLKEQCEPANPRFKQWRKREMARGAMQLGDTLYNRLIYMPFSVELTEGCSVGCGFCAFSAPKLSGIYHYNAENAALWRDILPVLKELIGPASRWGNCYYATDPMDNPDYEKFCLDFSDIMGMFPQTTTALPLKNLTRTKELLKLSRSKGCKIDRFSILSLKVLEQVHRQFNADELFDVELILQNPEAISILSESGRFLKTIKKNPGIKEKQIKKSSTLYGVAKESTGNHPAPPGTISCLSGFLINMVNKSCRLISPCNADKKWPQGYIVYDEGRFTDAGDFRNLVERMIRDNMPLSVTEIKNGKIQFRRGLRYKKCADGFEVSDTYKTLFLKDENQSEFLQHLGDCIFEGTKTAGEIALLAVYKYGISEENTIAALDLCLHKGVLNHEPEAEPDSRADLVTADLSAEIVGSPESTTI